MHNFVPSSRLSVIETRAKPLYYMLLAHSYLYILWRKDDTLDSAGVAAVSILSLLACFLFSNEPADYSSFSIRRVTFHEWIGARYTCFLLFLLLYNTRPYRRLWLLKRAARQQKKTDESECAHMYFQRRRSSGWLVGWTVKSGSGIQQDFFCLFLQDIRYEA